MRVTLVVKSYFYCCVRVTIQFDMGVLLYRGHKVCDCWTTRDVIQLEPLYNGTVGKPVIAGYFYSVYTSELHSG